MNKPSESSNLMMSRLKESNERINQLLLQVKRGRDEWNETFDAITDIITIHDKNFKIIRANKAFFERYNISMKELSERKCYEIFHSTGEPWPSCPVIRSAKSLKPECEEVDDPNMGGIFLVSAYPLLDEKGKFYGVVRQTKDITFQKKVEMKLIGKAKELEKTSRELEDFVYIISHDLKEPLFAIEGYTSRISKFYKNSFDDKGKLYINRIKVNIKKMSQKIYEIMEVIKIGRVAYSFKNHDSALIVKDVVKLLGARIKAGKIDLLIQGKLPVVLCDKGRLKDVFLNLLVNAIKFMGKGDERQVKIGCDKDGGYYRFFVVDTGIGIQGKYQEQIFKIFRRLNDIETEGTGVGLAIVKKIIEIHNGKVWVESPANGKRGSKFYFTIPISRSISSKQN